MSLRSWLAALLLAGCAAGAEPPEPTEPVRVPGGAFWMGGQAAELQTAEGTTQIEPGTCLTGGEVRGCDDDRHVQRCVVVSSFALDRTEVTNHQYRHCVARGGCSEQEFDNAGAHGDYKDEPRFDGYPAVSVTWFQAKQYCEWLGKRLPSEAEWEYAATGPAGRRFPWGDDEPPECTINIGSCSGTTHGDREGSPVPIASPEYDKDSTPELLIRDLGGNVREWVADVYEKTGYCDSAEPVVFSECGADDAACYREQCAATRGCTMSCEDPSQFFCTAPRRDVAVIDPAGPSSGSERVIRGAGYGFRSVCAMESSNRWKQSAATAGVQVGFRCAQDLLPGGVVCHSSKDCGSGDCQAGFCADEVLATTSCAELQ